MNHLTNEDFWDLTHGITGTDEWNKLNAHLQSCNECQSAHRILLKVEMDVRSTPDIPSGFALRVSAAVRRAENGRLFNRPVFHLFRWTLITSILVCIISLMGLINSVKEQLTRFVDFYYELIPENAPYYFIAVIVFLSIWLADKLFGKLKRV